MLDIKVENNDCVTSDFEMVVVYDPYMVEMTSAGYINIFP